MKGIVSKIKLGSAAVIISTSLILLAGCTENNVVHSSVTGTLYKVKGDSFGYTMKIILKDGKDISVLGAYCFSQTSYFDWYKYLNDLIGERVTIYYTQDQKGATVDIVRVECHSC